MFLPLPMKVTYKIPLRERLKRQQMVFAQFQFYWTPLWIYHLTIIPFAV